MIYFLHSLTFERIFAIISFQKIKGVDKCCILP